MAKWNIRPLVLSLFLAFAPGCASDPPAQEPAAPKPAAPAPAPAPAKKSENDIVVKKGDRTKTEATYLERSHSENISIDVKNADLAKVILPIFKAQAGVWIEYNDKLPKKVPSFYVRDLHWKQALGVLCLMTHMHLTPVEGSRVLEIKDGYQDPERTLANWTPDKPHRQGAPQVYGADSGGSRSGGGSYGGSPGGASSGGGEADPADAGRSRGADQIDNLRRGVGTTNSGAR